MGQLQCKITFTGKNDKDKETFLNPVSEDNFVALCFRSYCPTIFD